MPERYNYPTKDITFVEIHTWALCPLTCLKGYNFHRNWYHSSLETRQQMIFLQHITFGGICTKSILATRLYLNDTTVLKQTLKDDFFRPYPPDEALPLLTIITTNTNTTSDRALTFPVCDKTTPTPFTFTSIAPAIGISLISMSPDRRPYCATKLHLISTSPEAVVSCRLFRLLV